MKTISLLLFRAKCTVLTLLAVLLSSVSSHAASAVMVGWSEYGLWETDTSDVSVFSMTPPYSSIHAQLMTNGVLITSSDNVTVTYEAVADSNGSINKTSVGKGNFFEFAEELFGVPLGPDQGLEGYGMPGVDNEPQAMTFDPSQNRFTAQGIPVTPYDDQGNTNNFPLMKLVARNAAGDVLATTQIAVPVSDAMDCRSCHGSGANTASRPPEGWAWDTDPVRDYKLNILRSHDGHFLGSDNYTGALEAAGYNSGGLVATVLTDDRPVNCIRCHSSNAIPGSGLPGRQPLTTLMHLKHAFSSDPDRSLPLVLLNDTESCLRCHAGPETLRVRGVHHNAISPDGSTTMQCTSCHGRMTDLAKVDRKGWLDQPNCQSCHTGTTTSNNGQIHYTNVIDAVTGLVRQPVSDTFATEPNVPSEGLSLFKSSHGHGGLSCQACHGSTHAELGSLQANDNVQSLQVQGQVGQLADCNACHTTVPRQIDGGPHGLHPMDDRWATDHDHGNLNNCKACHGNNSRGTVLSAMLDTRRFSGDLNGLTLWQGNQVGCYNCHDGPNDNDGNGTTPSTASHGSATTTQETPVDIVLQASGGGLVYRAVSQPAHGTVTVNGNVATYLPEHGYVGTDSFTFAANNDDVDSNLATISISVTPGECTLIASALVPDAAVPGSPVPFRATAELSQCTGLISYEWNFGDGSTPETGANVSHNYPAGGDFNWSVTVSSNGASEVVTGLLTISETLGPVLNVKLTFLNPWQMQVSWPADGIPTSLENSYDIQAPYSWIRNLQPPQLDPTGKFWTVRVDLLGGNQFWRVRRVP